MFMSWLDLCLSRHNLLLLHFISVFTQMGYVYWDKKRKIEEKMVVCHLLFVQIFHYLLFTLLHSVPPHLLFGYIRFSVILHLLASWYNFQTLQGTAKWCMAIRAVCFLSISPPCPRGLLISFSVAPAFMV